MNSLIIQSKTVGPVKNPNCKFTFVQMVKLFVLFPFFSVKTAADYAESGLGRVFSHTAMKCILGFKAMFLCYTDGKTQLMLDGTVQAETGKNSDKPQGLTRKQKECQYTKERAEDEKVMTRKEEMLHSKIANAIGMLRRAIAEGIRFDYLLVDSWFPCTELLRFIHSRHFGCNLIGMLKMGRTKYRTALGEFSAPDIVRRLVKSKSVKYSPAASDTIMPESRPGMQGWTSGSSSTARAGAPGTP